MNQESTTVRLKVSPAVAKIVGKTAPRDLQLSAARGAVPLQGKDLLTALLFLAHSKDGEVRSEALSTMQSLPASVIKPLAADREAHPRLLDFIGQQRFHDLTLMEQLLFNPSVEDRTLISLAGKCEGAVLSLISNNDERLIMAPEIIDAMLENPKADRALKFRFGWKDPAGSRPDDPVAEKPEPPSKEDYDPDAEDEILSKYQQALEFGVSDKIKYALTGDKEWRTIFLKDPNKLVHTAVLKNPRITEGEILMIAKNRSAGDELIRLINLNREWVKNYEIRRALVLHPRTPLPRALRYMATLGERDIKALAKSRNVSQVIVNNARRMVMAKEKKR